MGGKKRFLLARASFEVAGQLVRMFQVITDDLIHVGQPQTVVLLHDLFGSRAAVECPHDQIERHPRATDAVYAMNVSGQWDFVKDDGHIQIVAHCLQRRQGRVDKIQSSPLPKIPPPATNL